MIRVMLIEDAQSLRGGLAAFLNREHGIAVVADVDIDRNDIDGNVVALAMRLRPQVVLMNTDYMVSQVLPLVNELKVQHLTCSMLILSDPTKPGMLPPRRRARELSFLVKGTPVPTLAEAIRQMSRGVRVMDPRLEVASIGTERAISTRELEILGMVATGDSVADIARRLYLSLGTVRNYLSSAILKTGARNRIDAIRIARKGGWLK